MKRFFPTLQREGSAKKPTTASDGDPPSANSDGATANAGPASTDDNNEHAAEPLRFVSWNANSFILRLKNNLEDVTAFLKRFDADVIAIQEVRIPAAGRKGEPKNQGEMKDDTSAARDDKQFMMRTLSRPPFADYKVWWSLADSKYGGTGLLVKRSIKPLNVRFSFDQDDARKHEPDGRVILVEFKSFFLMNTYSPNNGWKEEESSFPRRRKWDQRILDFVSKPSKKPLIWCGDLNVSHEDIDVSHPDFFKNAKMQGYVPPNVEDIGQPGFTQAERDRFSKILKEGQLIDSYRWLNKQQDMDRGFSWSGNPIGKYRGKRMRIDYFLISKELLPRLLKSDIHGRGIELEGFLGSDHCPITMELSSVSSSSETENS